MSQTQDFTAKPTDILGYIKGYVNTLTASATNASLAVFKERFVSFIKKYWWVLLPFPIMVIYWAYNKFFNKSKKGKR